MLRAAAGVSGRQPIRELCLYNLSASYCSLIGCYDYDVVFVADVQIKLELRSFSVLLQQLL